MSLKIMGKQHNNPHEDTEHHCEISVQVEVSSEVPVKVFSLHITV